jgi:hypothetical protein
MSENIEEKINDKSIEKISGAHLFRLLAFIAFGATTFTSTTSRFSLYHIGFGALVLLLFGWIYKHFLRMFLGLFNPIIKKSVGKKAIPNAVENSMLFLVPFAVMSLIATYYLKWSMTSAFLSTGFMSVGTAASIEVGKLRDKPVLRNTVISMVVSFLFVFLLTFSVPFLSKVPPLIEGVIKFIPTLMGKGGGL